MNFNPMSADEDDDASTRFSNVPIKGLTSSFGSEPVQKTSDSAGGDGEAETSLFGTALYRQGVQKSLVTHSAASDSDTAQAKPLTASFMSLSNSKSPASLQKGMDMDSGTERLASQFTASREVKYTTKSDEDKTFTTRTLGSGLRDNNDSSLTAFALDNSGYLSASDGEMFRAPISRSFVRDRRMKSGAGSDDERFTFMPLVPPNRTKFPPYDSRGNLRPTEMPATDYSDNERLGAIPISTSMSNNPSAQTSYTTSSNHRTQTDYSDNEHRDDVPELSDFQRAKIEAARQQSTPMTTITEKTLLHPLVNIFTVLVDDQNKLIGLKEYVNQILANVQSSISEDKRSKINEQVRTITEAIDQQYHDFEAVIQANLVENSSQADKLKSLEAFLTWSAKANASVMCAMLLLSASS